MKNEIKNDEHAYVGNIPIKNSAVKTKKKKGSDEERYPLYIKILVVILALAMLFAFIVPLLQVFITAIKNS